MGGFGARFRECRKCAGLKQSVAAKLIGVSQGAISYYERDEREPTADILVRMADVYDVSLAYLLGVTDEREPFYRGA